MSLGKPESERLGSRRLSPLIQTTVAEEPPHTNLELPQRANGDEVFASDDDEADAGRPRATGVRRTYSMAQQKRRPARMNEEVVNRTRRMSHDAMSIEKPDRRFIVDVDATIKQILEQEDTDGDNRISLTDTGPKVISLGTAESNGYRSGEVRGTYMISNLLQELALEHDKGEKRVIIEESRLSEDPIDRLSRMIRTSFWDNLTRRIDADGLEKILQDPKNRAAKSDPTIYVPPGEPKMIEYYRRVAKERPALHLHVEVLPERATAEYTRDLNEKPGLLSIAMREKVDPKTGAVDLEGVPFIVPGSRFNEFYNWDSYFVGLGLLADNRIGLAQGIVDHYIFEIKHYHRILNGNRTYYLMRSQPPFLTDLAMQVYARLKSKESSDAGELAQRSDDTNKEWLKGAIRAAIKEYHTVWMSAPRLDPATGLSRYRPEGVGVPPETEASHFTHVLRPYADKHGCSINEYVPRQEGR